MGHGPKKGPVFPLCTNTSLLAPAISLTTRLYSHLCSIYNQKYCHFIVVCNMFDQHPTIINNRCMDGLYYKRKRDKDNSIILPHIHCSFVFDLHCRCLITLCVIYILCNLYLFMSH